MPRSWKIAVASALFAAIVGFFAVIAATRQTGLYGPIQPYVVKDATACFEFRPGHVSTVHAIYLKGISQQEVDKLLAPRFEKLGYKCLDRNFSNSGANGISYEGPADVGITDAKMDGMEGVTIWDHHHATVSEKILAWVKTFGYHPYAKTDVDASKNFFSEFPHDTHFPDWGPPIRVPPPSRRKVPPVKTSGAP